MNNLPPTTAHRITPDPICGHCGKPLSQHFREDQLYCFDNTNGDVFTDDPSNDHMGSFVRYRRPELYAQLIQEWKQENGHAPAPVGEEKHPLAKLVEEARPNTPKEAAIVDQAFKEEFGFAEPLSAATGECKHDWAIYMIELPTHSKPGITKCLKCGAVDPTGTKAFKQNGVFTTPPPGTATGTARVDAEITCLDEMRNTYGDLRGWEIVEADFARGLERENIQLRNQIELLQKQK